MKANEAPKKIQLGFVENENHSLKIRGISYLEETQDGLIEYIRTDAFIEKACEWLQGFMECSSLFEYEVSESEKKKVIEDFKKYMKGE